MTKYILTQERLKQLVCYDSETGVFTWLRCYFKSMEGKPAGCIQATTGYRVIGINQITYYAARLAFLYMKGNMPTDQVDHINHIRHDNRWCNLREVTHQENNQNRTINPKNTSGIVGVSWCKPRCKYRAQIMVNRKGIHLGYYDSLGNAAASRKAAEIKYEFHENHGGL